MSLNRRLHLWLLGQDPQSTYFPKYALRPLTQSLKKLLVQYGSLLPDPIRVCKIALALLDKWEIGGRVMSELFIPVMQSVFENPDPNVLSTARALFDSMDPAMIWAELFLWIEKGRVTMLIWVVDKFNLREEEMLIRHIPQVLLHILCLLRGKVLTGSDWFMLCQKLIQLVPSRAFLSAKGIDLGPDLVDSNLTSFVREYYTKISGQAGMDASLPESIKGMYFHRHILSIFTSFGEQNDTPAIILEWTRLLEHGVKIVPPLPVFSFVLVLDRLCRYLNEQESFELLGRAIETTIALVQYGHIGKSVVQSQSEINASTFIHVLWKSLDPEQAKHHVESVTYLWSLTSFLSTATVEDLLVQEIEKFSHTEEAKHQVCARFSTLWRHAGDRGGAAAILTKSMMLMLSYLKASEGSAGRVGVEKWLASLGSSAHRYVRPRFNLTASMFDIIFSKLLEDPLLRLPCEREHKDITVSVTLFKSGEDDLSVLSYHLSLLLQIFRFGNQNLRAVCADDKAVLDPSRLELLEKSIHLSGPS